MNYYAFATTALGLSSFFTFMLTCDRYAGGKLRGRWAVLLLLISILMAAAAAGIGLR